MIKYNLKQLISVVTNDEAQRIISYQNNPDGFELYTVARRRLGDISPEDLEKNRYINVEPEDWFWYVRDEFIDKLEALGYGDAVPYFSGFGSQGDGACFTCDNIDIEAITKRAKLESVVQGVTGTISHRGHYYHEKSMSIVLDCTENEEPQGLYEFIEAEVEGLSLWYYRQLEDLYYELISDELVREALSC